MSFHNTAGESNENRLESTLLTAGVWLPLGKARAFCWCNDSPQPCGEPESHAETREEAALWSHFELPLQRPRAEEGDT